MPPLGDVQTARKQVRNVEFIGVEDEDVGHSGPLVDELDAVVGEALQGLPQQRSKCLAVGWEGGRGRGICPI